MTRPATIWITVGALIMAAGLCLVTALLAAVAIVRLRSRFDDMTGVDPSGVARYHTDDYADGATYSGIIELVLIALVFATGYGLAAQGVWNGRHWPRMWVSVSALSRCSGC